MALDKPYKDVPGTVIFEIIVFVELALQHRNIFASEKELCQRIAK